MESKSNTNALLPPMKKVTSILFIGPSTALNPITTESYPTFLLPVLNRTFLEINLRWLAKCSNKIVIVVLRPHEELVKNSVKKYQSSDDETFKIHNKTELSSSYDASNSSGNTQNVTEIKTINKTCVCKINNKESIVINHSECEVFYETKRSVEHLKELDEFSSMENQFTDFSSATSEDPSNKDSQKVSTESGEVCLENTSDGLEVEPFIDLSEVMIEYHVVDNYDGTFNEVSNIDTEDETLLITKCDIVTGMNPHKLINEFYESDSPLMTVMASRPSDFIIGHSENKLVFYGQGSTMPHCSIFNNFPRVEFSSLLDNAQIYVAKKSIFKFKLGPSFKKDAVPFLVNQYRAKSPVAVYIPEKLVFRANSIEEYIITNNSLKASFSFPNRTFNMTENRNARKVSFKENDARKSVVGVSEVSNSVSLFNSIVGNNVKVGNNVRIGSCLVMEGATIGDNCILEKCIIGIDTVIISGTVMNKCIVGCGFKLDEQENAKGKNYISPNY